MFQSHVSYSQCGLGSSGTDRLVALVEQVRATRIRAERGRGSAVGTRGDLSGGPLSHSVGSVLTRTSGTPVNTPTLGGSLRPSTFVQAWRHSA